MTIAPALSGEALGLPAGLEPSYGRERARFMRYAARRRTSRAMETGPPRSCLPQEKSCDLV